MAELTGTTLLGRYRVEQFVARGGMADVYRGFDRQRQVSVALKFMRPDFALDREFERRFRREAATLEKLSHPNIVRYYELQRDGDQLFMVMDFIEGVNLQRYVFEQGGTLPPGEVLAILKPLASALQYAHGEGVIHRDLKPSNVMLSVDGQVLLTDFGVAKLVESATVTAVQAGTPAYMSPEQCASKELDGRSDQYSLAVLAYEMLSGRRPFIGESEGLTTGTVGERIRIEHLSAVPVSPSVHNPALPAALDQTLLRALAKQPSGRFQSLAQLTAALERAFPGVEVAALRVRASKLESIASSASSIAPGWWEASRRRRGLIWMMGALAVVAAVALLMVPRTTISNLVVSNEFCVSFAVLIDGEVRKTRLEPGETTSLAVSAGEHQVKFCDSIEQTDCWYENIEVFPPGGKLTLPITNRSGCDDAVASISSASANEGAETGLTPTEAVFSPTPTIRRIRVPTVTPRASRTPTSTLKPTVKPEPTNTPSPTRTPFPTNTPVPQVSVDDDDTRLREGPGLVYDVVKALDGGSTLNVLGYYTGVDDGQLWYKVQNGAQTAWIAERVVNWVGGNRHLLSVAQSVPPTPTPAPPTVTPTIPAPACHQTRDRCMTEQEIRDEIHRAGNARAYTMTLSLAIKAYNDAGPGRALAQVEWENRDCYPVEVIVEGRTMQTVAVGRTGTFYIVPGTYWLKICDPTGNLRCSDPQRVVFKSGRNPWYSGRGSYCD